MTFADASPNHPFLIETIIAHTYTVPQTTTAENQNRIMPILIKMSIIDLLLCQDLVRDAETYRQAPTSSLY